MENLFDLNIEKVLEHWEPEHAVREIIANALDEQILTNSQTIEIYKKDNDWHIRDYGRGLQYLHFTQNENNEKMESPNLIGKFGVGLKDALAVFYRKGIEVEINSKHSNITLKMANKSGFNLKTLHAIFSSPKNKHMQGTDFILKGISNEDIDKAKLMFLCFSDLEKLEETKYGQIYKSNNEVKSIYINGVQVATEDNFLFSYNITNINAQIKKSLNRERSNVGRTAYSDSIKNILKNCETETVLYSLVNDLQNIMMGTNKDESGWVDIATYAAKTLNKIGDVVFMTPFQRSSLTNQQVEILEESGKKLVLITDNVFSKLDGSVTTYDEVYSEYENSFSYNFIELESLTYREKEVYNYKEFVFDSIKSYNYKFNEIPIRISEIIKVDFSGGVTKGVYNQEQNVIIIKRSVLNNQNDYLGVLIHELAHYISGYSDNTREFENVLTIMLGHLMGDIISLKANNILKDEGEKVKPKGLLSRFLKK